MTLKRVFGLLLCSALALGSLAAADTKKVPLDVMAYGDNSSPEGQLIVQNLEAFKAANPGIELTYSVTFNDPFHEKARARKGPGRGEAGGYLAPRFLRWSRMTAPTMMQPLMICCQ